MKNTKKKNETKSAVSSVDTANAPSPLPPVGGADALPSVGAPTPPLNDNPVAVDTRKGTRVLQAEVNLAENAARELRASTTFAQALGAKLGTAEQIADAIDFAAQWYAQAQAGATWASYTQMQSNLAWNYALAMIDRMRAAFQAAAATDPAIEKELPNFTKLLGARQAVAAKAVATKRKIKSGEIVVNKSAKPPRKGTKVSTQETPAPTQTPAPAPADAAPAPVVVAPAPVVTPVTTGANGVNGAGH
jgi:hypothetical protein